MLWCSCSWGFLPIWKVIYQKKKSKNISFLKESCFHHSHSVMNKRWVKMASQSIKMQKPFADDLWLLSMIAAKCLPDQQWSYRLINYHYWIKSLLNKMTFGRLEWSNGNVSLDVEETLGNKPWGHFRLQAMSHCHWKTVTGSWRGHFMINQKVFLVFSADEFITQLSYSVHPLVNNSPIVLNSSLMSCWLRGQKWLTNVFLSL